jgi:hypothetical protein
MLPLPARQARRARCIYPRRILCVARSRTGPAMRWRSREILTQACCKALCQAISPERIDDKVNEDALAPSPMSRVGSL